MPLTKFQSQLAKLLSVNRTEDSHLAGGAALHFEPQSKRYSNDLDYFHDSVERVATAFEADQALLREEGHTIQIEMKQPGYIRALVSKGKETTKIEWAHDSAWRFMPTVAHSECGFQLHPIDIAVNKILALAGRDEPRDFLDVLYLHKELLPLGALVWAAVGKDPGFTPLSLLELLRRRGKYHEEDFRRLMLAVKIDLPQMKQEWLAALDEAEKFVRHRPPSEIGCLYYSRTAKKFIAPKADDNADSKHSDIIPHYGRPGGVLPNSQIS